MATFYTALNGNITSYYENTFIKSNMNYVSGKLVGLQILYYESANNRKKSEMNYVDNNQIGSQKEYHDNVANSNRLTYTTVLYNSKVVYDGLFTYYNIDGTYNHKVLFDKGIIKNIEYYHPDGTTYLLKLNCDINEKLDSSNYFEFNSIRISDSIYSNNLLNGVTEIKTILDSVVLNTNYTNSVKYDIETYTTTNSDEIRTKYTGGVIDRTTLYPV